MTVKPPPPVTVPPGEEPPAGEVKGQTVTAADLLLGCTERLVVLEDVVPDHGRVKLVGVADRRFAGRTAAISFVPTSKVVARPKVSADGSFSATAPLPPQAAAQLEPRALRGAHRRPALAQAQAGPPYEDHGHHRV